MTITSTRMWMAVVLVSTTAAYLRAEEGTEQKKRRGVQLFYRMVGSQNNAPILPKTRSTWTQDRQEHVGNTGMADEGFTEYPFCYGLMDFTFVEAYAIYPRLISGAQADESIVNTADMMIDHVYEPDGCVWGPTGREFVQTFKATQSELVSITLLVASEPGTFRAALVEGGVGGRQIGPAKTFVSGHSMTWGTARWNAGQAPLVPGHTYGIRLWREDGKAWMPYLHSLGNAYDDGLVYLDGTPRPETDLALWIVEEPADLKRAVVENTDDEGWAYGAESVSFVPRTQNVRMITASVSPVTGHCNELVLRVWSADGRLVAGPKRGLACGPDQGERTAPFLFATNEFPVEAGQRYRAEVYAVPHYEGPADQKPEEKLELVSRDMRLRVYGEPVAGALPAVYNLATDYERGDRLKLKWSVSFPCAMRVVIRGDGMTGVIPGVKLKHVDLAAGETATEIPVWPGHTYEFELIATGPTGMQWRTPTYQVRMPREPDVKPLSQTPPYPKQFVTLAPPRVLTGAEPGPIRYRSAVTLVNPDFEDENGLNGWTVSPADALQAADVGWTSQSEARKQGIDTRWGSRIAGFTHLAGEKREQVFAKSTLSQKIATTPGHAYALAGMVLTKVTNGPRGDTRVRLFADPDGADEFDGVNSSQWYWTDGAWRRFEHRWVARANQSTVGFGFFRWRDLDAASAYVDHVHVYDLGPAPADAGDPPARVHDEPGLVLIDPAIEADDKVEGYLEAPPGCVITGLGSRAHYDNITTMWMRVQPLQPDGTLGEPEELRCGWEEDANLEACVELPEGYVATGFGAGIAPEWDVKRFGVWARPMHPDGTLGEEKLFRSGIDLKSGFEKEVRVEEGRVLTAAGLNCMLNDVNGIKARSALLTRTATTKAKAK